MRLLLGSLLIAFAVVLVVSLFAITIFHGLDDFEGGENEL